MIQDCDIAIVGGGAAGAAAALLLAEQGREVALIDAQPLSDDWPGEDFDPRVVAVSPGSAAILAAVDAWPLNKPERVAPYATMQVCAASGQLEFRADQHGLEALGWIVEIPSIRATLWARLEQHPRARILCPNSIESIDSGDRRVRLKLADGSRLDAQLLVAADGARSRLRRAVGIDIDSWHYNQHALIAPVETEQPNPGIAWQRFTGYGPLAFLPLADGRSSIVWSQPSERTVSQAKAEPASVISELNRCQDSPMGQVPRIGPRHALPLIRRRARQFFKGRVVLLGDAARSVHPLAGQGLNLGLADAAALCECLSGQALEAPALMRYQRWRRSASEMVGGGIHLINETNRLPVGLGQHLLGAGFIAANSLWPAREVLIERACGFDSDSPQLAQRARSA
jgi:ubiquinone biosynthesis UbiH/UbiF/VisC/COQ6 family hydroxylase